MGPHGQLRTQQSRASGAVNLLRYGRFVPDGAQGGPGGVPGGSQGRARVQRIAQYIAAGQFDGALDEVIIDALVDVDALDAAARLPAVEEGAIHQVFDGRGKVGILAHIGRVFATQFHPEKSGASGLALLENFVKAASGS